jgi:hypothetical protein
MESMASVDNDSASRLGRTEGGFAYPQAYSLAPGYPTPGPSILLRPSIARTHRYRNINLFPISYAFQPRLRGRLTLGRLPLPRKPWAYGERVSHSFYRYSCQHIHFPLVQHPLRNTFIPSGNAPLPSKQVRSEASVPCLASIHFRRNIARPVSYYAFFKGWLLLSQPPGCLSNVTSLATEHGFRDLSCRSGLFPSRPWTFAPKV